MSYRLTKIYTRTGDDGCTNLGDNKRILKNTLCVEALGTLDELNCTIGLVIVQPNIDPDVQAHLIQIQHQLFDVGGELCPPHRIVVTAEYVTRLEQILDQWNATLPPLKEFLLPQGNVASATCHLARAICRRAERCLVALNQEEKLSNPEILRFINRLSDLLFVAARMLAKNDNCVEVVWEH